MSKDLTMQEVIADSMIALVNAADGMDQQSFAHLLENVALKLAAKGGKYSAGSASATFKPTGHKVSISTSDFPGEGSWSYQNQVHVDDRPPLTSR
jgi:hypothetical protein